MNLKAIFFFLIALIFLPLALAISEKIGSNVVDNGLVFDSETKQSLIEALKDIEINTNGVQIVVYTEEYIPSGQTLEERTLQLAEDNGIGKKQSDNGLLLYVATKDRQYRWEVGYGLEPVLNSAWLGRVSREFMVEKFKEGDFEGGILAGLAEVEDRLLNSSDKAVYNNQPSDNLSNNQGAIGINPFYLILMAILSNNLYLIIFLILFFLILKAIFRKRKNQKNDGYYTRSATNIFSSNTFGNSGSGMFGKGGFSGGGGHFGGGGFSGKF